MRAGQAWLHLYRLDPKLRGFEIVVASSNNKAVENVSAELPALSAIAEDVPDMRYFSCVADALRERECWALSPPSSATLPTVGVSGAVAYRQLWKNAGCFRELDARLPK